VTWQNSTRTGAAAAVTPSNETSPITHSSPKAVPARMPRIVLAVAAASAMAPPVVML
jgi:hypothetical protein